MSEQSADTSYFAMTAVHVDVHNHGGLRGGLLDQRTCSQGRILQPGFA